MDPNRAVVMHLQCALRAYGSELLLPAGRAVPRAPAPEPAAASDPEPASERAPAGGSAVHRATAPTPAAPHPPAAAPAGTCAARLAELRGAVQSCTKCRLHEERRQVVFGEGNPEAEVLFVGEAPGAVEDQTGRPFVGPAGQLLDRILNAAMGLRREEVYIANVNKCRPPGNRDPQPDEVAACLPYLTEQIRAIRPRVIVALGRVAAHNLLGRTDSLRQLRGQELAFEGIPVVATYHPAALLRDASLKADTWEDVKRVNRMLGRPERPAPIQRG